MSGSSIGNSLKRKLGPLPVWAWAVIAGIALYVIRSRQAPSAQAVSAAQQQNQSDIPPQAPVVLSPGESVYDPNTGYMSGGGGNSGGGGLNSIIGLIEAVMAGDLAGRTQHTSKHHPKHHHRTHHHVRRHHKVRRHKVPKGHGVHAKGHHKTVKSDKTHHSHPKGHHR